MVPLESVLRSIALPLTLPPLMRMRPSSNGVLRDCQAILGLARVNGHLPFQMRLAPTALHHGNALPVVRPWCKVLHVGKYSNPSFGPFPQVGCSITGFSTLLYAFGMCHILLVTPKKAGVRQPLLILSTYGPHARVT